MSADYGRTFALTNQPTPNIWLQLNGNVTDSMGSSTVTTPGTVPGYVTLNYPGYTAQAVNLLNTAGSTATRYIRGTWSGATNFTVSLWFNAQTVNGTLQPIFEAYFSGLGIFIGTNNFIYFQFPNGGAGGNTQLLTSFTVSVNTWYYVTGMFQTNGLCSFYVNNTLIASSTNTGGVGTITSSGSFGVGTFDTVTTNAFNGYVDDIRITNSVSTYVPIPLLQPNIWMPFENTAGDLGSYSIPPSAVPTIYLPFEGNVTDSMGFTTVTLSSPAPTYVSANREGYTGQALRLTNTAGATPAQYARGTWTGATNFTVSGWFNVASFQTTPYASNNVHLFSAYSSVFGVYINPSNQLVANAPNVGAGSVVGTSSAISLNTWYYIQLIFRTGGLCEFYLNNVLVGSATNTGGAGSTTQFALGTLDNNTVNAFNGTIDDFRLYNSAIPYIPVSNVNITGSLSYVPGVVGLNAVNLVNTSGGTATNYIRGACPPIGSDITVCGWINVQSFSTAGYQVIFEMYSNGIQFYTDDANRKINARVATGSGGGVVEMNTVISSNAWYHVCLIFKVNGTCSFYLNGALIQTVTNSGGYGTLTSAGVFGIGSYATAATLAFNGYIDDFRIYTSAIPIHLLLPQNYRALALSGSGQYALASASSGWVVGSSDSSKTWSKQAVNVGTQSDFIQPQQSGLPATTTTWTQNGVTWTATESSNNGSTQSVSRAFNNNTATDAWLSNNTTQRYTAGSPNGNAASTTIQTIGATAGEWIQIQTSVPMILSSFAFGIGLNAYPNTATPKTYYIVGSTDGTTWVPLQYGNFTISAFSSASANITMNITGTQTLTGSMVGSVATTAYSSYTPNAYSYFRLIGTSLMIYGGSAGATYMEVGEWYLNFVRPFALYSPPTQALSLSYTGQYQLVATGPAAGSVMPNQIGLAAYTWTQGGVNWATSSSSVYASLYAYGAFNTINSAVGVYSWASALGTYSATTPFACATSVSTTIQGGIGATVGEWLQLQSSVPLVMQSYTYGCGGFPNIPQRYYIVGSNDGSTWYPIQLAVMTANPFTANFQLASTSITVNQSGTQTITGGTTGSGSFTTYATTTNAYTYFRFVITNLYGNSTLTELGEWYINFQNSVSYSSNYGSTWLNMSSTVSNESVALSPSGQYALSTNSVSPFARLTLDNTNLDAYAILVPATGGASTITYSTSIKAVGTHSALFDNTIGSAPTFYLNYILPTTLIAPSVLTMACWVYPTAYPTSNRSTIIAFNNTPVHGTEMSIQTTGVVSANFFTQGNLGGIAASSTSSIPLNSWSHIAMTYSAGVGTLFVNGVSVSSITASGNLVMYNGSPPTNLFVGTINTASYAYKGYVDDVRIYTSALSATAISTLYNNPTITQSQIVAVSNSYLPITSYTFPALAGLGTATVVDTAVSQTGQYMVAVTSSTTNNVYYSTDYGATFTALTIGSSAMTSCSISYDGSYLTVVNATTAYTLNKNSKGFTLAVGSQAGLTNQAQNAIAIGNKAGQTNQSANSIVLNATGNALDAAVPGFYVAPIATAGSSSAAPFSLLGYGTDNQVVQSSALTVLQNGYMGIGTNNPSAPLTIVGTATSSSANTMIILDNAISGGVTATGGFVGSLQFNNGGYSAAGIQCVVDTGGANNNGALAFYTRTDYTNTNYAERMRITRFGYVGIGTQNPQYPLDISCGAPGTIDNISWRNNTYLLGLLGFSGTNNGYFDIRNAGTRVITMRGDGAGLVGIGVTANPGYQLYLGVDSAAKPSTNTWTISSDERLKENIILADVDRCVEIIRAVPLKHYRWKDEVYSLEQVKDRSKLGWIAQDVEKVFPKAVGTRPFHYNQVYEDVVKDGSKEKQLISEDVIEDCRDLNADQMYAVMYGAIQKLISENDTYKAANVAINQQLSSLLAWAQTQGFSG